MSMPEVCLKITFIFKVSAKPVPPIMRLGGKYIVLNTLFSTCWNNILTAVLLTSLSVMQQKHESWHRSLPDAYHYLYVKIHPNTAKFWPYEKLSCTQVKPWQLKPLKIQCLFSTLTAPLFNNWLRTILAEAKDMVTQQCTHVFRHIPAPTMRASLLQSPPACTYKLC